MPLLMIPLESCIVRVSSGLKIIDLNFSIESGSPTSIIILFAAFASSFIPPKIPITIAKEIDNTNKVRNHFFDVFCFMSTPSC